MNLGIRAILYSARKWKKTLLVFCLLLAITTLVLSGLAIADAQEEQAEEVRGTTGASFTVERDISTGGWNGNYSTQEFMSEDMIQQIAAVDGIEGYDATLIALPDIFNDKGEELPMRITASTTTAPTIPNTMNCSRQAGLNWWKAPTSPMI